MRVCGQEMRLLPVIKKAKNVEVAQQLQLLRKLANTSHTAALDVNVLQIRIAAAYSIFLFFCLAILFTFSWNQLQQSNYFCFSEVSLLFHFLSVLLPVIFKFRRFIVAFSLLVDLEHCTKLHHNPFPYWFPLLSYHNHQSNSTLGLTPSHNSQKKKVQQGFIQDFFFWEGKHTYNKYLFDHTHFC